MRHSGETPRCPVALLPQDERKTALIVEKSHSDPRKTTRVSDFATARAIMRSGAVEQAGFNADFIKKANRKGNLPISYLEGEAHRRQRSATGRFFAPKVVATKYRATMERVSDELIADFRRAGKADLSAITLELAVAVAADIVGLTDSSQKGMTRRLAAFFRGGGGGSAFAIWLGGMKARLQSIIFYFMDVRPAIAARRKNPREDVISHLIGEGYSWADILMESLTYAAAGMVTTREFIVMTVWHFADHPELKDRFLSADEDGKLEILEEVRAPRAHRLASL